MHTSSGISSGQPPAYLSHPRHDPIDRPYVMGRESLFREAGDEKSIPSFCSTTQNLFPLYVQELLSATDMGKHILSMNELVSMLESCIDEGRRLQWEEDEVAYSRCRSKLSKVRRKLAEEVDLKDRYRNEAEELRVQLSETKDRLLTLQLAYDELSVSHAVVTSRDDVRPIVQDVSHHEEGYTSFSPASDENELQNDSDDDFEVFQQVRAMEGGSDDSGQDTDLILTVEVCDFESQLPVEPCTPPAPSGSSPTTDGLKDSNATAQPTYDSGIEIIKSLITQAYEGDEAAHKKVLALIRGAEQTPKALLTPSDHYLLQTWGKPMIKPTPPPIAPPIRSSPRRSPPRKSSLLPALPVLPAPKVHACPEIFVDASAYGIGFVMNKSWQAWKFKKGHPSIPAGPGEHINMSWAEIIAAEMGIRTLIAAGYRDTSILVRSDNDGVVRALTTRTWKPDYGLLDAVLRIVALCKLHKLEIHSRWISTKVNPADDPSRGIYPPSSARYYTAPPIPSHLEGMIKLVP